MARRRRNRKPIDTTPQVIKIDSLAHDGRGVGRGDDGKVVFVDYALPGETVRYVPVANKKSFMFGSTIEVLEPSEHRIEPKCEVFGQCGGCVLQHLDETVQITYKQQQLLENFKKIGDVQPEALLEPLTGQHWGYRRRARLGAKFVPKKGGLIVGFRERTVKVRAHEGTAVIEGPTEPPKLNDFGRQRHDVIGDPQQHFGVTPVILICFSD